MTEVHSHKVLAHSVEKVHNHIAVANTAGVRHTLTDNMQHFPAVLVDILYASKHNQSK